MVLAACGRGDGARADRAESPQATAARAKSDSTTQPTPGGVKTILFLGTSLTAGYGLDPDSAYPALIQNKIDSARWGAQYVVRNAGLSGETSAGARRRIEWLLNEPAYIVVIETGANDGLRGVNVDSTRANIQGIIDLVRTHQPDALMILAGMEAPRNMGQEYITRFRALYRELAERNRIQLIPFLLDGVAAVDTLNQADGIHPNSSGSRIVAENVWRVLKGTLR